MTQTKNPEWEKFLDSEYLRSVLLRIATTDDGWRTDPEADDLIGCAAQRFAQLARKAGLEETDAMSVAFEAMRNPSTRHASDPWAVIVHAVATTFRAWTFAEEALCSIETARRGGLSGCRAVRMCERDHTSPDADLLFAAMLDDLEPEQPVGPSVYEQACDIAHLLAEHGWDFDAALLSVEVILARLADTGSRPAAYEALRRDRRWRAVAGIPAGSWTGLLRLLLGSPSAAPVSDQGRGLLLRLALGEDIHDDPELTATITATIPRKMRRA